MDIKIGDKFAIYGDKKEDTNTFEIVNINDCRPPEMKYAVDVWDAYGNEAPDVFFLNDQWFENHKDQLERIG